LVEVEFEPLEELDGRVELVELLEVELLTVALEALVLEEGTEANVWLQEQVPWLKVWTVCMLLQSEHEQLIRLEFPLTGLHWQFWI